MTIFERMPIKEIKGYDILPLIKDPAKPETIREATVHHSIRGEFAIRRGKWKLLCSPRSGGWSYPKPNANKEAIASLPLIQLYGMDQDPGEKHNVYKEHPDIVEELRALLQQYIKNGRSTPGTPQKNGAVHK